jgi:virginiamycin B lyase
MPAAPSPLRIPSSLVAGVKRLRRPTLLIGALFVAYAALATGAQGYVYWTNEQDGTIGRALPDGSGKNQSFLKTGGQPAAVAVDGTHIYWAHRTGDDESIGRANIDGSGKNPNFIPFLSAPSHVAVDGTHIYWSEASETCNPAFTVCFGSVGRANLDGSGIDYEFINPMGASQGVSVNATHVYFSYDNAAGQGLIGRANHNGSGVQQALIAGLVGPSGTSLNSTHIYWANQLGTTIGRANLNGTGVNNNLITGVDVPCATAVDAGHLYWTERGRDSIGRATLDGSSFNKRFITGAKGPCGIAVDSLGQDDFSFGKVKRNKRKGTAKLPVNVPGAGGLALAKTKKVKGADKAAAAAGSVKLPIKPKGKAKKKLNRKGKAKVKAEVTYSPQGGTPSTKSKRVKLKKR